MQSRASLVVLALVGCLATAACVRTDTELLDSSTAAISARGGTLATPAKVFKKTLMEAATLAQAQGYPYFAIVSAKDATRAITRYHPPSISISGNLNGTVDDFGNVRGRYEGTGDLSPGYTQTLGIAPGEDVVVKFYREGEVDPHAAGVWDVSSVLSGDTAYAKTVSAADTQPNEAAATWAGKAPPPDGEVSKPQPDPPAQRFDEWRKSNGN